MTENRTGGRFESALRAGKFVVTAEVTPPDSANPQDVVAVAKVLGRMAVVIERHRWVGGALPYFEHGGVYDSVECGV